MSDLLFDWVMISVILFCIAMFGFNHGEDRGRKDREQ